MQELAKGMAVLGHALAWVSVHKAVRPSPPHLRPISAQSPPNFRLISAQSPPISPHQVRLDAAEEQSQADAPPKAEANGRAVVDNSLFVLQRWPYLTPLPPLPSP